MVDPSFELNDPSTTPERLAALAQQHPELGAAISAHPNAYPELQAWIAQYAAPLAAAQAAAQPEAQVMQPEPQPTQPEPQAVQQEPQAVQPQGYTQPTEVLDPQPTAWPGHPQQPQAYDPAAAGTYDPTAAGAYNPAAPAGYAPQAAQPGTPAKKRKTILFVSLGAALLLLLAIGGGVWWFFGSKLGGSATPEAAAKKLVTSVTSLDPLSLYGSLAPSEFSAFEPAAKTMLATQTDENSESAQKLIDSLKREVKITTTTPLTTESAPIIEGEVERVTITEGVIEIDGDPEKVADVIMDFYAPIAKAQSEAYGYSLSKGELEDVRDTIAEDLADELPYEIDFSDLDFDLTVVSVKEGGSWFVSPMLTFADYAHLSSGGSDRALGDEIIAPASNGAKSPEAAATMLTEAIVAGDYDAIVSQMPLPERRLLSVYGESLLGSAGIDPNRIADEMSENGLDLQLEAAEYAAKTDGGTARVTIDRLAFSTMSYDYWSDLDLEQNIEIVSTKGDTCVLVEGERAEYVDYWGSEYDYLWEEWLDDRSYLGSFSDWLDDNGYNEYEIEFFSEENCLSDLMAEQPMLENLGIGEWSIIAVQENGTWKISPLGTIADISAIITAKVSEAAEAGKLDELFS